MGAKKNAVSSRTSQPESELQDVPPQPIKWAAALGIAQGVAGVAYGLLLLVRFAGGFHDPGAKISGFWTAVWFFLIFGGELAAGMALRKGKRWGRGPILMIQLCLIPVSIYMFISGRPELGIPTAGMALLGLGLLFNSAAVHWSAATFK